jgi:hypothetical protein
VHSHTVNSSSQPSDGNDEKDDDDKDDIAAGNLMQHGASFLGALIF